MPLSLQSALMRPRPVPAVATAAASPLVPALANVPPPPGAAPRQIINIGGPKSDALAKALMSSGLQGNKETPMEAIGSLAQVFAGKRAQDKFIQSQEDKTAAEKQALLDAYTGIGEAAGTADPLVKALIASGHPELAGVGIETLLKSRSSGESFTLGEGQTRFDAAGNPIAAGAPKPEETFRPVTDPQERVKLGIPQDDQAAYQVGSDGKLYRFGPSGTAVNVNTVETADVAESKELGKARVQHFGKIAEDLPAADSLLQSARHLNDLVSSTDTGTMPGMLEFVRKNTGVVLDEKQADKRQAVESLVDYLTPRMRVPGSGATSDMEMRTFRNSLPNLLGTPGGNALVSETLIKLAERRVAMAAIAQDYLSGAIKAEDAIGQMKSLPDPFAEFKARGGGEAAATPSATPAESGSEPAPIERWERGPDGKIRRVTD